MSAFAASTFAVIAPLLADYGYRPVPIKPGFKAPMLDDWQTPRPPTHYLPRCAAWGTGILTANCPAIDLDIRDLQLVRVLIDLAGETLGSSPFRVGAPPKALLPFSTSTPFDKLSGRWWALPGDDYGAVGYAPHRIEILGDGQQFVAYARHPRGTFYRWRRFSPIATMRDGLPPITDGEARAFLTTAEDIIKRVGGVPLKRFNGIWGIDRPQKANVRRPFSSGRTSSEWSLLPPETLAKAIDATHAARIRGGWITSCPAHASEGHRSLSITSRGGGGSVVHCFGECSFPEIARAIEDIVGGAA